MKWLNKESAPKDCNTFIADVGFPFAVIAVWDIYNKEFHYADLCVTEVEEDILETWFETESFDVEIKAWMPMPSCDK